MTGFQAIMLTCKHNDMQQSALLFNLACGAAILDGVTDDPDFFPPLADESALREWLAGFEAAWWALPECSPELEANDPRRGTLIKTLSRALADRPVLLDRLLGLIESAPADTLIEPGRLDQSGQFLSDLMSGRLPQDSLSVSGDKSAELSTAIGDNQDMDRASRRFPAAFSLPSGRVKR